MKNRSLPIIILIAASPLGALGCRPQRESRKQLQTNQPINSSIPLPSPEVELSVKDLIKQWPFIDEGKRLGMLRAWSRVPNGSHYRVAQKADFENPILMTDYGELAGAYGLATLIVDKTAVAPGRMSLMIFVERPNNRSDIYWIYRAMDLSKYKMSRASGDIFVDEVHDDGTISVCEIRYDKKERTWACRAL
jgi:hypothetical protein